MKKYLLSLLVILFSKTMFAQNVGIGVPNPTQKLEVSGAIKVGTTATNQPGTIRYNGGKFEGGDGTTWKNLEALPIGGLVASKTFNNPALLAEGYTLAGEFPGITSYNTTTGSLSALQWWPTYINGVAGNNPPPPSIIEAVSTGSLMYVVTPTNLYSYNPVTDVWTIVSNQGLPNSSNIKGIWTGTELIFWNSVVGLGTLGHRYNPSTNVWATLPTLNSPSQRTFYSMIWDGTRVIIWGGRDASVGGGGISLNTGAFFNPSTNTWTTMNTIAAPIGRYFHTAVWDNISNRMIVWGGTNGSGSLPNAGGLFNPTTNSWTGSTSLTNAPPGRIYHSAVWAGNEMIIYGGNDFNIITNNGGRYNPSTNTWTPMSTVGANFTHRHAATWTGTQMIVTGGRPSSETNSPSTTLSSAYNPVTNTWLSLPNFNNAADAKDSHYSFLMGNMVLIWGGRNNTGSSGGTAIFNNTGYRYFLSNIVSSSTTIEYNASLYLYQKN